MKIDLSKISEETAIFLLKVNMALKEAINLRFVVFYENNGEKFLYLLGSYSDIEIFIEMFDQDELFDDGEEIDAKIYRSEIAIPVSFFINEDELTTEIIKSIDNNFYDEL